jgi:hypothetical protein
MEGHKIKNNAELGVKIFINVTFDLLAFFNFWYYHSIIHRQTSLNKMGEDFHVVRIQGVGRVAQSV